MFKLDKFNPISMIVSSEIAGRAWCIVACLAILWAFAQPHLTIREMKKDEKVIVITDAGEILYAENQDWQNATRLHSFCAKKCVAAATLRNPSGPDDRELIERTFTSGSRDKLHQIFQQNEQEFREKQIHQKAEILQWVVLDKGKQKIEDDTGKQIETDFVVVQVEGQLIKTGAVKGLAFRDDGTFKMKLTLIRNTKLLENHYLPLVCADFEYTEKKL